MKTRMLARISLALALSAPMVATVSAQAPTQQELQKKEAELERKEADLERQRAELEAAKKQLRLQAEVNYTKWSSSHGCLSMPWERRLDLADPSLIRHRIPTEDDRRT